MTVRQRIRIRQVKSILQSMGLFAALLIAGLVQLAETSGLLQGWNDGAYNAAMRFKSHTGVAPARVLLVYADSSRYGDQDQMLTLLGKLEQLGAAGLGLTVPYNALSSPLIDWSRPRSHLVFAAPKDSQRSLSQELTWGRVDLIHAQTATYGRHYGMPEAGDRRLASLEATLAQRMGVETKAIPHGVYGIDFRGSVNSLPHVDAQMVWQDELTSEFVRGRAVLVGLAADPLLPGVATPTTTDGQRMSLLEFHGQALNTILTQRAIGTLPERWRFPLYLGGALASILAFRRQSVRFAVAVVILLSGAMRSAERWCCGGPTAGFR